MSDDALLLPLSALQHFVFCERQCALIHLEGMWEENRLTAEGRLLHDRTHASEVEVRGDTRIVRGLWLRSEQLGVIGRADVVEFHRTPDGVVLSGVSGRWLPFPVEYKRGRPKPDRCDEVQLCAQALCLEEMLECDVSHGAIFYGQPRRRTEVAIDETLRTETVLAARRLQELIAGSCTPPARYQKKCRGCSLLAACMPRTAAAGKSARTYLDSILDEEPIP